ncbi:MAG: insulinase family protein [Polyangiaceae bacterium]|nr:insulinase family protein [Polyangiaceae bacterium]
MLDPLSLAIAGALFAAAPPPSIPVKEHRLANGLTLLLSEDHRLPVVAVEVRYLVGSGHERAGRTGFAHLFEHLMFQGSEHHDREYFAPFEPIGADVNGTTSQDRTNYYEQVPSNFLGLALWMESDRMGGLLPVLTQAKLDNQRDVVKNERRQRYENTPYGGFSLRASAELFPPGHPYHHTPIGSHEDLGAAALDDVSGFFRQYYVPSNAVVTLVGDFDPAVARAEVERYFGGLPAGKRAPSPAAPLPRRTDSRHVTETDDVKLPRVHLAWVTPALFSQGDAELDLLASLLTEGKTSRLYQPLVFEQRVASDVAAYQASMKLGSYFVVQATAAPGKSVDELARALTAALGTSLATPPTDAEFGRALNRYRKDFFERAESVLDRTTTLSTYWHVAGTADWFAQDLARYTSATPARVHEQARAWIRPEAAVRIDIVPETARPTKEAP